MASWPSASNRSEDHTHRSEDHHGSEEFRLPLDGADAEAYHSPFTGAVWSNPSPEGQQGPEGPLSPEGQTKASVERQTNPFYDPSDSTRPGSMNIPAAALIDSGMTQSQGRFTDAQAIWSALDEADDAVDFDLVEHKVASLDGLKNPEMVDYLREAGASADAIKSVSSNGWNGKTWVTVLDPSQSVEALAAIWDLLMVHNPFTRLRLMADVREAYELRETNRMATEAKRAFMQAVAVANASASPSAGVTKDHQKSRYETLMRVRVEYAPKIPTGMHAPSAKNSDEYQVYRQVLTSWIAPYSRNLAETIDHAARGDSEELLTREMSKFEDGDKALDGRLASYLYAHAPSQLQARLSNPDTREINGEMTVVKIMSYILSIVEHATDEVKHRALRDWMSKASVDSASKLLDEVLQFETDVETLLRLKVLSRDEKATHGLMNVVLMQMIEKLMTDKERQADLTLPVIMAKREHPNDAGHLLNEIKTCAMAIQAKVGGQKARRPYDPDFKRRREAALVAAGMPPEETICFTYRENNKCAGGQPTSTGTPRQCPHMHTGRTGKVCSDGSYTKTGLCEKFRDCKDCHPWDEKKFGPVAKLKDALKGSSQGSAVAQKRALQASTGQSFSAMPWHGEDQPTNTTSGLSLRYLESLSDDEMDFDLSEPASEDVAMEMGELGAGSDVGAGGEEPEECELEPHMRTNRGKCPRDKMMEHVLDMQMEEVPATEEHAAIYDSDLENDASGTPSSDGARSLMESMAAEEAAEGEGAVDSDGTDFEWTGSDETFAGGSMPSTETIVSDADDFDWRECLADRGWAAERIARWEAEQEDIRAAIERRRVSEWADDNAGIHQDGLIDSESGDPPSVMMLLDGGTFMHMIGSNATHSRATTGKSSHTRRRQQGAWYG